MFFNVFQMFSGGEYKQKYKEILYLNVFSVQMFYFMYVSNIENRDN